MARLCRSVISTGIDGILIDVECHVSNNLPTIVIIGFASRAVNEAKDRLRGAFASSRLQLPRRRITVNLAPADIPKTETSLDLAIAIGILASAYELPAYDQTVAAIGELGLDGHIKPIRGIIGKLLAGRKHGVCSYFVPEANMEQASLVPGISLLPIKDLGQLHAHLTGLVPIDPIMTGDGMYQVPSIGIDADDHYLDDVAGQDAAKRALIIAAAGGHNLLLTGPPGTGKSMLAKTLPGLMPAMSHEEMLEAAHLNSLTSTEYNTLDYRRPLRSPHHSASHTAMVGGGRQLRPGEISLSHCGVLFLDELPEFSRPTLEALRQPLEDRMISVSRSREHVEYPADFMLVATANPCPCGYNGFSVDRCNCSQATLIHYKNKLSGPILDRIDLCCDVHQIDHKRLFANKGQTTEHISAKQQIEAARKRQSDRHGSATLLNHHLSNRQLRVFARLDRSGLVAMQDAAHRLQLSARGYMRTIRVARTIADLEGTDSVLSHHIGEALQYRHRPV